MPAFTTKFDVCNVAAQLLGVGSISSFTGSKFAVNAGTAYERIREGVLRRNVWTCCTRNAVLRAIDLTTVTWTPPTYSSSTTYPLGAVVVDSSNDWWQSLAANNLNNTPSATSNFWTAYFGPDSMEPFSAPPDTTVITPASPTLGSSAAGTLGAATYYVKITYTTASGETLPSIEVKLAVAANHVVTVTSPIAATGATKWNVYISTTQGMETLQSSGLTIGANYTGSTAGLVIGQFPPSTIVTTFRSGELTTYGGQVYLSLADNNVDTPPTANWLAVNGTTATLQILYPIACGPRVDNSTNNVYRVPHGYLRKAPTNPKGSMFAVVGVPTGAQPEDWIFQGGYIISRRNMPIMLRFVANIQDVRLYDPLLAEAIGARMAIELCIDVTQSAERLVDAQRAFSMAMSDARGVNGIEVGSVASPIDDWILVRA